MRVTRRGFTIGAAALALAPSAIAAQGADELYPYRRIGQRAPAFTTTKFGGGTAQLADYRGQTLILAFGGLWCPDCVVEERELNQLAGHADAEANLSFLALHTGDRYGRWGVRNGTIEGATAAIAAYRREMNVAYPLGFDLDGAIADAYGLEWFPTILIIDRQGVIQTSTSDLRQRTVARFLGEARAEAARR